MVGMVKYRTIRSNATALLFLYLYWRWMTKRIRVVDDDQIHFYRDFGFVSLEVVY